jgi:hypothetical protein
MGVFDYIPLDLSDHCNAGIELLGPSATALTGHQTFHGLPFQIGRPGDGVGACFLAFGGELGVQPVQIPVHHPARRVIVAHRLLESQLMEGGPVGTVVAEYVFHMAGVEPVRVPVRERFEISTVPTPWGHLPFLAVPDQKNALYPRYEGRWGMAGNRQTESIQGSARAYFLWAWANPYPDQELQAIEVVPKGPKFLIAAITLGLLDEDPFCRAGKIPVKIELPQPEDAQKPFNLEVEVDRGVATYPYPLPQQPAEGFLCDPLRGWGEQQNTQASPSYVEVAATPSATVTVKQDGQALGSVRWGELVEKKALQPTPRLRLEIVDRGLNWVHTTVLDDETGAPLPCRIHFRTPEGIPYAPHGHHAHVNSNLGTWHVDIGGDVRLGQITYAYIDGRCQGWLPRGEVIVDVARGFEYEPLRTKVTIWPGQRELVLRLKRWTNMNRQRWFSGDTHVHFLSTIGSQLEARGEDLNVVNLLQSQWGSLFTSTEEFTGGPHVSPDGQTIVYCTQENRQHMLGHLTLLGLKQPVMPWCSDGPSEAELGGTLETTLSWWADECHRQGGIVIIPHLPAPNGEPAALIATGRVDGVEMLRHGKYMHLEYYRYLNCGYRLPLVGGTDKMTADVPVGIYRTYVYIPPDEEFTYESWCRNLRLGRTFLSGGPLLHFTVEGHMPGDTIQLPGNGGIVEVEAIAESIFPIHRLEVVQHGRVVAAVEDAQGTRRLHLKERLPVTGHTWLAARVSGPGYYTSIPHHDGWGRGIFAHTSPVYVAVGGEWWLFDLDAATYMLTLIDGTLAYIRQMSPQYRPGMVTHHHGEDDHVAFLERPFLEARAAIHRRMHELGIAH